MNKKTYTLRLLSVLLTLALLFSSCQIVKTEQESITEEQAASKDAFDSYLKEELKNAFEDNLISLHYTFQNPDDFGIEKPDQAYSDLTDTDHKEAKEELLQSKDALCTIDKKHLAQTDQILYETLEKYIDQQLSLCEYPQFYHVLSASTGISSNLPLTLAEYAFTSEEDVKDYLLILTEVPDILEDAYAWEKNLANDGYSLCDFEIEDIIDQIDHFFKSAKTNQEDHLLVQTFDARIDALSDLSKDQRTSYKKNNKHLVTNTVLPAFAKLKEDLTSLLAHAPTGKGFSLYEHGADYYELLIQSMTLSDRSMDSLIKTLEKRMNSLVKRIGKVSSSNPKAYDIFCNTSSYIEATPEEMLKQLETYCEESYPKLKDTDYTVEPIPDALKNNTTAAYYMLPAYDSTEENRIYYGDAQTSSASLFLTLSHEGYPGHLYHQNYLLQNGLDPIYYVLDITGYKEGWAYYVQIDSADYCDFGEYDEAYHDELVELYRCNDEFSYCISSLIDLYVNYKGYNEEDVANVLMKYGLDGTSAKAFYEYAVEEPGAYLQYYVGYLELLAIRNQQEKSLGNHFNEKDFHTKLLNFGPCYYEKLGEIMRR